MLNEGNRIHNFISSSGSDFLTSYGAGSGSTRQKVMVPTVPVPVPVPVPQHCFECPVCVCSWAELTDAEVSLVCRLISSKMGNWHRLNMELQIYKVYLSRLYGMDYDIKPSHATVPLNMELNIQSLFVLLCTDVSLAETPQLPPSLHLHLGLYTRALLVS
jgi:hypothetical protein